MRGLKTFQVCLMAWEPTGIVRSRLRLLSWYLLDFDVTVWSKLSKQQIFFQASSIMFAGKYDLSILHCDNETGRRRGRNVLELTKQFCTYWSWCEHVITQQDAYCFHKSSSSRLRGRCVQGALWCQSLPPFCSWTPGSVPLTPLWRCEAAAAMMIQSAVM